MRLDRSRMAPYLDWDWMGSKVDSQLLHRILIRFPHYSLGRDDWFRLVVCYYGYDVVIDDPFGVRSSVASFQIHGLPRRNTCTLNEYVIGCLFKVLLWRLCRGIYVKVARMKSKYLIYLVSWSDAE